MTHDGRPQDIEEILLGGPLRHTRAEVERLSGVSDDYARRIWQALGFPTPPDDEVAFTDGDADALREIKDLLRDDLIDEEMVLQLARAVGQTMGRLASWLGDVWLQRLGEAATADVAAALAATGELRPAFERLLLHGWRRQLAAAGMRAAATTASASADPAAGVAWLSVGFADVVSFTQLSRRLDGDALAAFVERFESTAAEAVAEHGGRVVKTLGDEVLFVASDPGAAAEIGLRIAERFNADPEVPKVRVGMAYGEVIQRLGDVFGTPVNLAARLTATARAGTVLVDGALAAALPSGGYDVTDLRPRPLQGLGRVRPRLLRRAVTNGRGGARSSG
ncbi:MULTISPECIES: adenylate/guanylate cyclase domain-containing protein [Actinomadura]|uniref:Adenylate/guanylate cyclase domain-containing protein n=1 Tax=Actinomadura litoris TaxID=2678616 RepID=A0A7K1L9L4_9ACTN|nr:MULTISPECIES: adenylate/guanylate cyclase domain-containing protein [Actinomadura]MBT2207213.1 adenylate/guanylate cyclase domain-containing protein [Actinomadura sp. NEAU-AAG7]MUN41104.1 adenylate/guanylate cyclase domain-containing protein [Actinomadura litoris]